MPSRKIPKWLMYSFVGVSFLGLLDATYLTVEHFTGEGLGCFIFSGCDIVTSSEWSVIMGIPLALMGAIFYFGMLILSLLYIDTKKTFLLYLLPLGGLTGFIVSCLLVYLQLFVIEAICTYCMISATTSTVLFILGIILFRKLRLVLPT
jgi:uncharacterized membrane protein